MTEWVLPVHELMHQTGQYRDYSRELVLSERLGEGVMTVPEGSSLDFDARVESVHEGLWVTGTVHAEAEGQCSRCLTPLTESMEITFEEMFPYQASDDFDYAVEEDLIDLEPVIRDHLVLELPFAPVCADGCEKPELPEGITLTLEGDEEITQNDPRWSTLLDWAKNQENDR